MKITVSQLRRLIAEAVADHMRLPKGPNSRDDAENSALTSPKDVDHVNIEDDKK